MTLKSKILKALTQAAAEPVPLPALCQSPEPEPQSPAAASAAPRPAPALKSSQWLPPRILPFIIVDDRSRSMENWHPRQGVFIPGICAGLIAAGGEKVLRLIYIMRVVISSAAIATEFTPLGQATDPVYVPNGNTPLGTALGVVAEKTELFFTGTVFPAESSAKKPEIVLVSDLMSTGETAEQTEQGVRRFLDFVKKFKANVTIVGPCAEEMNMDLAARLDVGERGIQWLDSDPNSLLQITLDSLVKASEELGNR